MPSTKNNIHQDQALFAKIAEDDVLAFRQLFDKYYQTLRLNAIRLLKSDYWSEEVTQEAFLYIWESRATLRHIENPGGWLYRILSNKCLDRLKRQSIEIRAQYMIDHTVESNREQVDYHLLRKLIAEAVAGLPEQQRLVYQLQQEELSYKEIGERLGISPNTVKNHLVRAFAAIRQHLIKHGEFFLFLIFFLFR